MRSFRLLPALLLTTLLLALGTGCGVTFSDHFDGTELFKGIELEGEREVGAELALTVKLTQTYPIPVYVACYYEDDEQLSDDQLKLAFHERATRVGETVLPPAIDREPGDEIPSEELTFRFRVEEPGDYFIACLTPAAPDNGYGMSFKIADDGAGARR